jgi:ABC-type nitrate/sulfonate/bicarbonate transport system permease component
MEGVALQQPASLSVVRRKAAAIGWALVPVLPIAALALAWELLARSGAVTPFMLPAFSVVMERIWTDALSGAMFVNIGATLYRTFVGFAVAALAGVVIGVAISRSAIARWFFDPIVSIGFPMPKVAFLPVIILWLGVYDASKIAMIIFDAIFPVITATIAGVRGVERELIWSARSMGASEQEMLRQVMLPAAFPQIMTGLQVALPIAMILAVFTEMVMGGYGLGGAMMYSSRFADSTGVFAGIVEIAVVGYVLVRTMAHVRRRLLLWHQEVLAPSTV